MRVLEVRNLAELGGVLDGLVVDEGEVEVEGARVEAEAVVEARLVVRVGVSQDELEGGRKRKRR